MNTKSEVKYGEVLPPLHREVGIKIGSQVYVPAMPSDPATAAAQNRYLGAFLRAVSLIDQYHALREQYAANRSVIWCLSADVAAREEEEVELKHQRKRAELRREREIYEDMLAALEAKHAVEAREEFKDIKFASGAARFAEKTAKYRVGEAVANASMGRSPDGQKTEEPAQPARPPLLDALLQGIDELEKQIEEREASGQPADALHRQRDALRELLMRELKKGR